MEFWQVYLEDLADLGVEAVEEVREGDAGSRADDVWERVFGLGRLWWTTTGPSSWPSLMSCSIPSAASMQSRVLWLVAFKTRSWGSWHFPLSLPLPPSLPIGSPSIASARALCFSSTLRSMSWTEPKASSAERESVWSCSLGSPSAMWLRAPGGVKGLSLPASCRAALPLVIWSTWSKTK